MCGNHVSSAIGSTGILILLFAVMPALSVHAASPPPVKIALFEFELEDVSAAGASSTSQTASDSSRMQAVTAEARRVLAQSGRHSLIDTNGVDAESVKEIATKLRRM
jgi:hypothetical protein